MWFRLQETQQTRLRNESPVEKDFFSFWDGISQDRASQPRHQNPPKEPSKQNPAQVRLLTTCSQQFGFFRTREDLCMFSLDRQTVRYTRTYVYASVKF